MFVRGLRELNKRLKGIAPFGGKQISGVEAESGKALSPGSFQIPCDHVSEFIDLGKVVFFVFLKNSNSINIDSHFNCVSFRGARSIG